MPCFLSLYQMLNHFRLIPFLAGLVAGLVLIFWYKPSPLIIREYPHPQNVKDRVYRDLNGVCYKYSSKEVECDEHESTLRVYPLQTIG